MSGNLVLTCDAGSGWITARYGLYDHEYKVCWLPKDRRGLASATSKHALVVGAESGIVTILSCSPAFLHAIEAVEI
jgi:hypothetical protein